MFESRLENYAEQKCVQHEPYLIEELCIHCDKPFCSRCVAQSSQCPNHARHEVVAMKVVADQRRVKISELNVQMSNKMKCCRAAEEEAWINLSYYENEVKGYCDDIDMTAEALIEQIRHDAETLKRELRNHVQRTSSKVLKFSEEILNNISHLDEMYKRGEKLAERSSDNEVITEFTHVTDQLKRDAQNTSIEKQFVVQRVTFSKDKPRCELGVRLILPQLQGQSPEASNNPPSYEEVNDQLRDDVNYQGAAYVPPAAAIKQGKSIPNTLKLVSDKKTAGYCSGVSLKPNKSLLCAVVGGVDVRSADLTLQQRIKTQGSVHSAHTVDDRLITKMCFKNKYSTYIGTEKNPTQTLICEVKYKGFPQESHMSTTNSRLAVIDKDNRQLRVYSITYHITDHTADYLYSISLAGMKSPYGVHILPDDTVLVTDCTAGGELRKYPLHADAEPVWTLQGIEYPTGVTSDESGYIYVKCDKGKKKIKIVSPRGEEVGDLYSSDFVTDAICDISVRGDVMVLACGARMKLFRLMRD